MQPQFLTVDARMRTMYKYKYNQLTIPIHSIILLVYFWTGQFFLYQENGYVVDGLWKVRFE